MQPWRIVIGALASAAAGRTLVGRPYGVAVTDPVARLAAAAAVALVAALGAARAARVRGLKAPSHEPSTVWPHVERPL